MLEKVPPACWEAFQALRSLKLQELSLDDCPNADSRLFGHQSGLSALKLLNIEESTESLEAFEPHLEGSSPESQQLVKNLYSSGANLLKLPSLIIFSGVSRLFMAGVMNGHEGWVKTRDCGCIMSHEDDMQCACVICRHRSQVWERA